VEEGSLSRTLAFDCGQGYAHEEYAMKTDRQRERERERETERDREREREREREI